MPSVKQAKRRREGRSSEVGCRVVKRSVPKISRSRCLNLTIHFRLDGSRRSVLLHKMDTADLHDVVGDLTSDIDNLEAALAPLTQKPLATTSSKLPLLDKAKLHVLATYALESILFNSLRLNGTDAKTHPVFAELNRVKEYFGKIKTAEGTGAKPSSRVDKDAAGRLIKAGLAGNDRFDQEREQRRAREKAGAKRKLEDLSGVGTHTRFDGAAKRIKTTDDEASAVITPTARAASDEDDDQGGVALSSSGAEQKRRKKKNKPSDEQKKAEKRERRQQAKEAKLSPHGPSDDAYGDEDVGQDIEDEGGSSGKSSRAPKSSKEALDSLLDGASSRLERKAKKKKKKSKGQVVEDERADEMK